MRRSCRPRGSCPAAACADGHTRSAASAPPTYGRPVIEDDDLSGTGDWTRPGVYRCAPDVYRIPLPLPQDGLRAVNVYALRRGDDITVIDAGWSIPESRKLLGAGLAELDAGFPDVRRFLVTH